MLLLKSVFMWYVHFL